MMSLIKILTNHKFLVVVGCILLIFTILAAGIWFEFSLTTWFLVIIIVLFLWIILLLHKHLQATRSASLLERSIHAQAEEQRLSLRPDKREEIEQLKNELSIAIESLKKSKLGKGKAALYALPWYMFIGPPAAGKTTAIINSGLEFPYGSDIKGIGGTRNCDWFFSDSAILLDTAGRYMTEDDDRAEWHGFLDILKKFRRRTPINGVIVGISITDLINVNNEKIEWHAKTIRNRIDELIQRLGVSFPVYLVFTKCDLLKGFTEIFENLGKKEREQVWGCTLTKEQQTKSFAREIYEKEFQLLYESLFNMRLLRLSSPTKPETRSSAYVFPLEFASARENLGYFIENLFQPNPYKESPTFRGFYFTSGTQEGVPIDCVIQTIAKEFDLPQEMITEPEIEKKSYFLKDFFTDVIIPDQNMVSQTSKVAKQKNLVRISSIAALIILLGVSILGISQAFLRSKVNLNSVKDAAVLIKNVSWDTDVDLAANFTHMERLREELTKIEERETDPSLLSWGLYKGNSILEPARNLFYRKTNSFVKKYLYYELFQRLNDFKNSEKFPREQTYNHLKAYLLMGTEIARLDTAERKFLYRELTSILDERFFQFMRQEDVLELKPIVGRQIEFFVDSFGKEGMPSFENDENLVKAIRDLIYEPPSIYGIYTRIKREARDRIQPFSLSKILGSRFNDLIFSDYILSGFFTKEGWDSYVAGEFESTSNNPEKEDWVLGVKQQQLPAEMRDPVSMIEELQNLYYREYAETWWKFLQSIQYIPFETMIAATDGLKKLSDFSDSPLIHLIDNVAKQTKFETGLTQGILDKASDVTKKIGQKIGIGEKIGKEKIHPLDRQFVSIHSLSTQGFSDESSVEVLQNILNQYAIVADVFESFQSEPGPNSKEYSSKVLLQSAGELPDALKTIRRSLSGFSLAIRKSIFEQPIKNAWSIILNSTSAYLNSLWQSKVYEPFQMTLSNYYPFNPQGQDAPIADVERFFQPQSGTLWSFVETELQPYVKSESWTPRTWEGQGIRLSSNSLAALSKASAIKKGLFLQERLQVNFRMQPDLPKSVSGNMPVLEQICLKIDSNEDYYRMGGVRWIDFSWPNLEGTPGASLEVFMKDGYIEPKKYEGEWGWFKLLTDARILKETSSVFNLIWLFGREDQYQFQVKYKLQARSAYNPFSDPKSFFNFRCPRVLR